MMPQQYPDFELPDSRLAANLGGRPTYTGRWGLDAKVFCANCGKDGGLVTDAWAATMFYLCNDCKKFGANLPEPKLPDVVQMYCVHCHINWKEVPYEYSVGTIYVCDECHHVLGELPLQRAPAPKEKSS